MSPVFLRVLLPPGQRARRGASTGLLVEVLWPLATAVVLEQPPKCHQPRLGRASSSEGQTGVCTLLWLALPVLFLSNI